MKECIDTAGCFKTYHDEELDTCKLRGNEIEESAQSEDVYAVNGRYCDDDGGRIWNDGMTTTRVSCLFSYPGSADSYLVFESTKSKYARVDND